MVAVCAMYNTVQQAVGIGYCTCSLLNHMAASRTGVRMEDPHPLSMIQSKNFRPSHPPQSGHLSMQESRPGARARAFASKAEFCYDLGATLGAKALGRCQDKHKQFGSPPALRLLDPSPPFPYCALLLPYTDQAKLKTKRAVHLLVPGAAALFLYLAHLEQCPPDSPPPFEPVPRASRPREKVRSARVPGLDLSGLACWPAILLLLLFPRPPIAATSRCGDARCHEPSPPATTGVVGSPPPVCGGDPVEL
ncbi:hypothetical protein GQ53DRAFT_29999 [Thozetella sp. PMI_491]|nr:hypothetical protein GQ53DRAFT_29999 [Thozetella sp. PMI_491]